MSDVDKRYSPSYWTERYPQERAVDMYIDTQTRISRKVMQAIPCERDVAYGEGDREKYDVFGTDLPDDAPILIFIHGGYWQCKETTKEIFNCPARSMHKRGIKTIVLGYSLCPECTVSQIDEKVLAAVRKCLDYAVQRGSRSIGIAGHSAGAQIAAYSILHLFDTLPKRQQDLFKGVFLLGGIFDLTEIVETSYNALLKLTMDDAKQLSPIRWDFGNLLGRRLKVFICVGGRDCPGFIQQSKDFYDALVTQSLGKQVELLIFNTLDHFDMTEKLDDDYFRVVQIVAKLLSND